MTPRGAQVSAFASLDGLGRVDRNASRLYVLGFDETAKTPSLLGFELATGAVVVRVKVPFIEETPEPSGSAQSVSVDESDGSV